ncbi:TetR-like C-terminal domain-containing protein, partial [Streptomyces chryseus]
LGAEFVEKLLEPSLQLYVKRLRAAQEAGDVRPDIDPRVALELLVAPLAHRWLLRTLPLTHAYADAVVDCALGGLTPR